MLKCYQSPQIATEFKTTLEYSGMDFQFGWKPGKFRNTEGFIYKKTNQGKKKKDKCSVKCKSNDFAQQGDRAV